MIAMVGSWAAAGGLEMVENDSDRAIVKGVSPGSGEVKVKVNGKTYRANIKVTKAADGNVQMSVDPGKEKDKDEFPMRLQGWARVMGLSDARTAIARMLYEVNTGARSPENFYRELGRQGLTMFDVIEVRSALVSNPDQAFLRSVLGATSSGGATAVEKNLLVWRREQTKAAVNEVLKRFIAEGRVPANGFNLIVSDVGKWATQADSSLTFTGDIDFSFVSNDVAYVEALKAAYAEVIKRRTGLDPIALDSVCTAHGKAGLEVYIGRHGMAFAEEQMKINEVVDMRTGARTKVEGDSAVRTIGSLLTIERHLADTEGVEAPKPAVDTEPGLSMEMVRHFDHDIAKSGIYDMGNAVVKAAKYLDRSYKALEKAGGTPGDPAMADFARRITELANAKPQTPATRNETTRLISDFLGSAARVVWEPGGDKFVLTVDQTRVSRFHDDATRAMWDTVKQGSNTRTAALDQRLRDLLEAQRKGEKVDEDVAKLRKEMVELVDMVEAEVKAAHGMDIPVEVHTNNAKVKAMLDTLSKRVGAKALSPDELKDKQFRSEERRVGKECRRLCRSRWSPYH
jgi:predicted Rdx family selenoprotein